MALQASSAGAQEVGLPEESGRALLAAGLALAALWAAKGIGGMPYVGQLGLAFAVFFQLWWPISRCDRRGLPLEAVGLGHPAGALSPTRQLAWALGVAALVLPAWAWASHSWWSGTGVWARWTVALEGTGHWQAALAPPPPGTWMLKMPAPSGAGLAHAAVETLGQVLGVALPEELFYRGYLLPQLRRRWAPGGLYGGLLGRAACTQAALFALGHWLGEWRPDRLLTFFPGLLFGAVATRQRGVIGAIALHAACNLFAQAWAAGWVRGAG